MDADKTNGQSVSQKETAVIIEKAYSNARKTCSFPASSGWSSRSLERMLTPGPKIHQTNVYLGLLPSTCHARSLDKRGILHTPVSPPNHHRLQSTLQRHSSSPKTRTHGVCNAANVLEVPVAIRVYILENISRAMSMCHSRATAPDGKRNAPAIAISWEDQPFSTSPNILCPQNVAYRYTGAR